MFPIYIPKIRCLNFAAVKPCKPALDFDDILLLFEKIV